MKKAIRCCISCILPCGSLDVIRIVHANGRVEEISGSIRACEIMKAYPKHVLKKPTSSSSSVESYDGGGDGATAMPRIVILPPDAQLERGKIYFLMPLPPQPPLKSGKQRRRRSDGNQQGEAAKVVAAESKHKRTLSDERSTMSVSLLSSSDQYLSELLSEEKLSTQRERRRGRVGVWRPHLESICESPGAGDHQL
ncbi:hypothetical protein QQ045_008162 [Rhodiola kirilowii]